MKIGIIGYGSYIPKWRIKVEEIAEAHNQNAQQIKSSLLVEEKSVPAQDEDSATLAVEAAKNALLRTQIDQKEIGAIYVGSESHPYAVKPTSTIVGQAINVGNNYMAADLEFACKAGTASLQIVLGLVKSGMSNYGLAIGADTATAKPGDILEYSASAGSAAFIIGTQENEIIATIDKTLSFNSNTPDFWRRSSQEYPQHLGRFTAEPSYFKHVINATTKILDESKMQPKDFDFVVFHQPNGKFPMSVAKKLGFNSKQINAGMLVSQIGNAYSASTLLGLSAALDQAKAHQKILVVSYGSGSGSDAFILTTTELIEKKQNLTKTTLEQIKNKKLDIE